MAGPAFSNATTTTLSKAWTNQTIQEHRVMKEADKAGSIKRNADLNATSETLKLNYASNTWETWEGLQTYTASENSEVITPSYTTGLYGDKETVRPDKISVYKNSPDRIYDLIEEALSELKGRAKDQWNVELFQGDGTALRSGRGTRIKGFDTIVPDAPASATINGISVASYSTYKPQVANADAGPGSDFDADRTYMMAGIISRLDFTSNGKRMRPSFGVCGRDLAVTMMDQYAGTVAPSRADASVKAEIGADPHVFVAPGGIPVYFDDAVATNELQFWNVSKNAFDILIPGTNLFEVTEHHGGGSFYGKPPIFELNVHACVRFRQPRAFGKLINANAKGSITLL